MMKSKAREDDVEPLVTFAKPLKQIALMQFQRTTQPGKILPRVRERHVGEIETDVSIQRTALQRLRQMARAAATEVEESE